VLVTGWFSWADESVTAGDLLARDVTCEWLERARRSYDVANSPEFGEGIDWREVDPARYSEALFVCGPVESGRRLDHLMQRFGGSRWVGVNVTMLRPLGTWNPFDFLLERDSSAGSRPDLAFAAEHEAIPLIGVVLVEPYGPEYPDRDRQREARAAVSKLLAERPSVRIDIDTRLKANETGLRSAAEVESAIARMDAVVTTRLHGLVLALKHEVPALAIDPVAGGAKISQQASAVGWPVVRTADALDPTDLNAALDYCLSDEARELARECAEKATTALQTVQEEFHAAFGARTDPA
jgi:Polysaccharide pyruvyl transferase